MSVIIKINSKACIEDVHNTGTSFNVYKIKSGGKIFYKSSYSREKAERNYQELQTPQSASKVKEMKKI